MKRARVKAAWKALRHDPPPNLGDRVELYTRSNTEFKTILKRAILVLVFGALIIAVALAWESLAWQVSPAQVSHHPESLAAELFTPHLWRRVLYDLGFAFLIAAIVTSFIEYNSIREQQDLLEKTIQDIGHSVIEGVYKIRHKEEYIRTVVNNCLAIRHVRKDYTVTYEVYEFADHECEELGILPGTLIKIVADAKYDSVNIGHDHAIFEGRYYVPKRGGKLENFAKITELKVGDIDYDEDKIALAEIQPGEPHYSSSDRSYKFPVSAFPDKPVPIHIKSIFVKERSDNEIFVFLYPTLGAVIKFFFHNMDGLRIGVTSRTASDSADAHTIMDGHVEWKAGGPILPNNYVTVWWRSPADDGEPEKENPSLPAPGPALDAALSQPEGAPPPAPPQAGTPAPNGGLQRRKFWNRAPFNWFSPSYWKRE
jgi:hypothetical protein